jgi:hypothetical protein
MNANYNQFTVEGIALEIAHETQRAGEMFPPMNSPHEAEAVIREEFDEYWDEVKAHNMTKPNRDTRPRQRAELIQLAAMCMRAIIDTIDKKVESEYHDQGNGTNHRIGGCSECGEGQ